MNQKKAKRLKKINGPKQNKLDVIRTEKRLSHFRRAYRGDGEEINIPVIDVRDGPNARARGEKLLKDHRANAGSKFMKSSYSLWGYSYNVSRK